MAFLIFYHLRRAMSKFGVDSFYTPPELAELAVSACLSANPRRIVDFAAGAGALLISALERWPDAAITAMDLNHIAIGAVAIRIPHATRIHGDFLSLGKGSSVGGNCDIKGLFDVILLNPPFSSRRNPKCTVNIDGQKVSGSPALTFVTKALAFLDRDGELVAILPSSCLTSERDASLREALAAQWDLETVGNSRSSMFRNCDVTINIVRIRRRISSVRINLSIPAIPRNVTCGRISMMRGTIGQASSSTFPIGLQLVHTTDLVGGVIGPPKRWTVAKGRTVSGSALLIPRVGRTRFGKIAIKRDPIPVALSDCVIAVKTLDRADESGLRELIHQNWDSFSRVWTGSCAHFLTLKNLAGALRQLGYEVQYVSDMATDPRVQETPAGEGICDSAESCMLAA